MRLPTVRPRQVVKVLKQLGFEEVRQTGSHLILKHHTLKRVVPVPIHAKDMKRGLLNSIIKQSGVNREKFIKLL